MWNVNWLNKIHCSKNEERIFLVWVNENSMSLMPLIKHSTFLTVYFNPIHFDFSPLLLFDDYLRLFFPAVLQDIFQTECVSIV